MCFCFYIFHRYHCYEMLHLLFLNSKRFIVECLISPSYITLHRNLPSPLYQCSLSKRKQQILMMTSSKSASWIFLLLIYSFFLHHVNGDYDSLTMLRVEPQFNESDIKSIVRVSAADMYWLDGYPWLVIGYLHPPVQCPPPLRVILVDQVWTHSSVLHS